MAPREPSRHGSSDPQRADLKGTTPYVDKERRSSHRDDSPERSLRNVRKKREKSVPRTLGNTDVSQSYYGEQVEDHATGYGRHHQPSDSSRRPTFPVARSAGQTETTNPVPNRVNWQQTTRAADSLSLSTSPRDAQYFNLAPGPQSNRRHLQGSSSDVQDIPVGRNAQPGGRHIIGAQIGTAGHQPAIVPVARPHARQGSVQSSLSPLAGAFAEIDVGAFEECKTFIGKHRDILGEGETQFLSEAVQASQAGETQYARSCVQQLLLINECSELSVSDGEDYLDDLVKQHSSTIRKFFKDHDKVYTAVKAQAEKIAGAGTGGSLPSSATGLNRHTIGAAAPRNRRLSESGGAGVTTNTLSSHVARMTVAEGQSGASQQETVPSVGPRAQRNRHRPSGHSGTSQPRGPRPESLASILSNEIEFRGTPGDSERLDPKYQQRRNPATFFHVGKVFAILWHENVGNSKQTPGPDVRFVRTGVYGERIFSHIRRMVVVRQRYGYCWCVAINSYSGRGIAGKSQSSAEVQAHTVVHDSKKQPKCLDTEVGMVKEPIAIDMARGESLDPMSRLNFAKVHTVEHNVKVMNVGKVSDFSLAALKTYWDQETRN